MKRIIELTEETSNKIAAGEVVERPYSVVKELVENSLDAGSNHITIEIEEGGQKLIRVTDDGNGIHPDDVARAFFPHATSKIGSLEDIYKLHTFGFRGEALASIASVSYTTLTSRCEDFDIGKKISLGGGRVIDFQDAGCNVGTIVEVKDLFYNVPARLKFLKSSQRESALISDIIGRLALANPQVSFKLFNNKKPIINTYRTENIIDTIKSIYSKETANNLIKFEQHSDTFSVYGYVGNAEISRGSRNQQSIFVNKRYIRSKLITAAVENAFKSFLTINKFPFFILFMDIYPELIDVNIHPTKAEIKFLKEREVYKVVFDAVHHSIKKSFSTNIMLAEEPSIEPYFTSKEEPLYEGKQVIELPLDLSGPSHSSNPAVKEREVENVFKDSTQGYNTPTDYKFEERKAPIVEREKYSHFPPLSIMGQLDNTYIIAAGEDGLYLIDQHAAHEKVLFEKYSHNINNSSVVSQLLLDPLVIELEEEDYLYYEDNQNIFKNSGFLIEEFDGQTLFLKEIPLLLGKPDGKKLFYTILDNLKNLGNGTKAEVKYEALAMAACKAAIKAKDRLSMEEMTALISSMDKLDNPFNCPHGRPTIVKISLLELEKRFKRIQ